MLVDHLDAVLAAATRAPSVHNTQPWRFRVDGTAVELHADPARRLPRVDPRGREMLISCGAVLFGVRLAIRELGYQPAVEVLPDPAADTLLARIRLGAPADPSPDERTLLSGLRRRHTHRGPFAGEPLPAGLLTALRQDAAAESAALDLVGGSRLRRLATLVAAADRVQALDPEAAAELRGWTRPLASGARDGVPARAFRLRPVRAAGRLAQRDFDLNRGIGGAWSTGGRPSATAILTTAGDGPADWLRAGQALHRLLLRAAARWVFASLHTQPMEVPVVRDALRARLRLPGVPQVVLQLGHAPVAPLTPRRPVGDLYLA
jgi:nitroreductase